MSERDRRVRRDFAADEALWRRARVTLVRQDEEEAFLDLAAFAEGRLDPDERERVAALLSVDTAADVEAARALLAAGAVAPAPERVIGRAILADPRGAAPVLRFVRRRPRPFLDLARWGSLAAAVAVAAWVGFALGSEATHTFRHIGYPSAEAFLPHLFDPATGFLHDLAASMLQ